MPRKGRGPVDDGLEQDPEIVAKIESNVQRKLRMQTETLEAIEGWLARTKEGIAELEPLLLDASLSQKERWAVRDRYNDLHSVIATFLPKLHITEKTGTMGGADFKRRKAALPAERQEAVEQIVANLKSLPSNEFMAILAGLNQGPAAKSDKAA